jgi:diaminopimelate decarboxylase
VESPREVRVLADICARTGIAARVAVRVNPDFELKSSGMKMGGGAKPFGVDAEQVPALLAEIGRLGLRFEGFHIYSGSQNLRADSICAAQRSAYELACRLAAHAPAAPSVINIGGGFGIPYFAGERALDLGPIRDNLGALSERVARDFPAADLVLELGRYLVGEAGVYVCRVVDRKVSRGEVFLVTDGGLHHHLAASGNFGQVIRKNYPVAIGNRLGSDDVETATVVGPLCTPLDLLAERTVLPVAQEGDFVVVYQSGAYGLTASPLGFLSHPAPAELLV